VLATVSTVVVSACGIMGERLSDYRYRLTVEVETPEGLRSGSSVIEVHTTLAGKPKLPDTNALSISVIGEAVDVDLGKRGVLFALLRSEDDIGWAGGAMNLVTLTLPTTPYAEWHEPIVANQGLHVLPRYAPHAHSPVGLPAHLNDPPKDYPMLVRFGDPADPRTIERVNPDDLSATFGEGVKLRRITVQLTDDPVSAGIEQRFRWLKSTHGALFDVPSTDYPPVGTPLPLYATLTESDFIAR
jgi:hypothetical protein